MVLAVVGFSFAPLVVDLGGGKASPFLLNASWRFGVSLGWLLFLVIRYPHLIADPRIRTVTVQHLRGQRPRLGLHPAIWLLTLSYFDYVLLGWATRFIDISVAAILFETWPVLSVVFLSCLFRNEKRFNKLTVDTLLLLVLALVGFAFVVVSQVEQIDGIDGIALPALMLGITLGLGAAIVGALAVYSFKWGFDLAADIEDTRLVPEHNREDRGSLELFGVVVVCLISTSMSCVFSAFAGFVNNETLELRTVLIGILLGGLAISLASICWRRAISLTADLGINAMIYLTPLVALLWLGVFSRIDVPHPQYLLIGTCGIIVANLLINTPSRS